MTVDYDLIIVGNGPVGRYAALRASQTGARVALVIAREPQDLERSVCSSLLAQLNRRLGQRDWLQQWNQIPSGQDFQLDWPQIRTRVKTLTETLDGSTVLPSSLAHLTAAGVDVVQASAEFRQRPGLSLLADERRLRSRAYLLTSFPQPVVPPIPGLEQFVTCDDWPQRWPVQPASLAILGTDPSGLLLAQLLNRLGTQVTLVTQREWLLPDPDLSRALQLRLEAEGVTVLTRTEVRQIEQTAGGRALRLIDLSEHLNPTEQVLETEALLLASTPSFDLTELRLDQVGVVWQPDRIPVNRHLQTSQPRIYACGIAPEQMAYRSSLAAEAEIALHNALFWPPQSAVRHALQSLPTDPELAWIGWSEAAARRRYGPEVLVVHQPETSLLAAQTRGGFLKLVVHQNGRLLGAQAMGSEAVAGLEPVALAMQQNLKLKDLARLLSGVGPTELLRQAAQDFQQKQSPRWRRELLESWFDFRRSR